MGIQFQALHEAAKKYREIRDSYPSEIADHQDVNLFPTKIRVSIAVFMAAVVMGGTYAYLTDIGSYTQNEELIVRHIDMDTDISAGILIDETAIIDTDEALEEIKGAEATSEKKPSKLEDGRSSMIVMRRTSQNKTYLHRAQAALSRYEWDKALELYNQVLFANPNHPIALEQKIFALEKRGLDQDLHELDRMLIKLAKEPKLHAARARLLAKLGRIDESLYAWQLAHKFAPSHSAYSLGLAVTYDRLGRAEEAIQVYLSLPKPRSLEIQRRLDYLKALHITAQR